MEAIRDNLIYAQLVDRRRRLQTAIEEAGEAEELALLLKEVDSALERMEKGSFGLCEVCHDPIEDERLVRNPLITTCLDHLTSDERRALEQDLALASQIQGELLPKQDLRFGGWEFSYHYEPAGPVSGDYCDLVKANTEKDGDLFFLLGDVSGKGVAASMLMAHLHAIFRSLIAGGLPVDKLVERANHIFCESTLPSHFATLVCGRAGRSAELEFCIAGHCPPMLVRNGKVTSLKATRQPTVALCATVEPRQSREFVRPCRDPTGSSRSDDSTSSVEV